MVMTLLRRAVGEKVALDMVLTGRVLDAGEAQAVGLVARVVSEAELDREAAPDQPALASPSLYRLAAHRAAAAQLDGRTLDDGVALGARINALARETPDFRAAIAQFLKQ